MVRQKKIGDPAKSLTLFVVCVSIAAYCFPRFSDWLVYDRQAILIGEFWRLLTASLVHFSPSHMFWNVLVFCAAGWAIEAEGFPGFRLVCVFSAVMPGITFLVALPELQRYGGLSGPATGAVAYFCLSNVLKTKKNRVIWTAILVGTGAKIVAEIIMDAPLFVRTETVPFQVLPSAHMIGYLGAFVAIAWAGLKTRLDAGGLKNT